MNFSVFSNNFNLCGTNLSPEQVENKILFLKSEDNVTSFLVEALLPSNLLVHVKREEGMETTVILESNGQTVQVPRSVGDNNNGLGVSCDPEGAYVPVETINIRFRNYKDLFTDRGLVWVSPGEKPKMVFCVNAGTLRSYPQPVGFIASLVSAAQKAVEENVLDRFRQAA